MKGPFSPAVWIGVGLAVGVGGLYVVTLTPGVPPTDSGELALAAWLPGIAHAPGFPLYTVLGWVWLHLLPVGRVIWRLNLLSVFCGALAVGLTYALALRTLKGPGTTGGHRELPVLAAAVGALALGLGRTAWSWATVAEAYALNLALTAAILLLLVRWTGMPEPRQAAAPAAVKPPGAHPSRSPRRAARDRPASATPARKPQDHPSTPESISHRPWALMPAAFLFGLGLGGHLTSTALLAPAIAYWLVARCGWRVWSSRATLLAALALLASAGIYLYLPWRAATEPLLNWGDPNTWQRFWWHVTARQYRVSLLSAPVWPQVVQTARLWWTQLTPPGLVLMAVGAWRTFRTQRPLFWMLTLVILAITLYAWAYVIEDDADAYHLPAFLAGAVWVAWGARAVTDWAGRRLAGRQVPDSSREPSVARKHLAAAVALGAILPMVALTMNWAPCNRRLDSIPEDYVRDTLGEIGPGGLLLTRDWQLYGPSLYLQQVEGLRRDVTIIDTELMRRGWYFAYLHRVDPALMQSVAGPEGRFLALRDAWERGDIPDGDPRIGQLQAAYVALLDALIAQADAAGRPVHVGPNRGAEPLRAATLAGQPDMETGVGTGWRWLPVGLTFRALKPDAPLPMLAGLQWRVEPFRQVQPSPPERKIQATRADMAALRGLVQAQAGNLAAAEADWSIALAVDPTHRPANEWMARLKAAR